MRVLIEVYRKWEIFFDTDKEEFYTTSNEYDTEKVKRSYASAKKFIDDYIKDNETFTPIWVQREDTIYDRQIKLVGLRKDGAFIYETKDGKKQQLSKYDEGRYFLVDEANDSIFKEIEVLEKQYEELRKEIVKSRSKLTKFTVEDYRKELGIENKNR